MLSVGSERCLRRKYFGDVYGSLFAGSAWVGKEGGLPSDLEGPKRGAFSIAPSGIVGMGTWAHGSREV